MRLLPFVATLLAFACVHPNDSRQANPADAAPLGHGASAAPSPNVGDATLSALFSRHKEEPPQLERFAASARASLAKYLTLQLRDGRSTAVAPSKAELHIVDARLAAERHCGADEFVLSDSELALCHRMRVTIDNCVVHSPTLIACDIRFLLRLVRYALVVALSQATVTASGDPVPTRQELRKVLLQADYNRVTPPLDKEFALIESILRLMVDKPALRERYDRIVSGFAEFVVAHEAGHLFFGHATGRLDAVPCVQDEGEVVLPPQLTDKDAANAICVPEKEFERQADDFATFALSAGVEPDKYTAARAAPEYFVEEQERRTQLAMRAAGLPETWDFDTATQPELARFAPIWIIYLSTGGHPQHMRRYQQMLEMFEARGIKLSAGKQMLELVQQCRAEVTALCRENNLPSPL